MWMRYDHSLKVYVYSTHILYARTLTHSHIQLQGRVGNIGPYLKKEKIDYFRQLTGLFIKQFLDSMYGDSRYYLSLNTDSFQERSKMRNFHVLVQIMEKAAWSGTETVAVTS